MPYFVQTTVPQVFPAVGFPIRSPPDHSLFAAPRGFSQLATTFIAFLMPRHPPLALISLDHTILLRIFRPAPDVWLCILLKDARSKISLLRCSRCRHCLSGSPDSPTQPRPCAPTRLRCFFLILSKNPKCQSVGRIRGPAHPATSRKHRHFRLSGGEGIRTPDLLRARQLLSQLSYTPDSGPGWT